VAKTKKRKPVAEINVVPYIDVMLVLLIIFMITAPLLTQGVNVELPQTESKVVEPTQSIFLVASIDASGRYFLTINGEQEGGEKSIDDLVMSVITHLKVEPKAQLLVRGDKSVPYGKVVQLMAALQKNTKLESVGLLTESDK
jgi:biopolymer transport protein TolR